jgi:hypothetical protein
MAAHHRHCIERSMHTPHIPHTASSWRALDDMGQNSGLVVGMHAHLAQSVDTQGISLLFACFPHCSAPCIFLCMMYHLYVFVLPHMFAPVCMYACIFA